jgi:hypothetical protein
VRENVRSESAWIRVDDGALCTAGYERFEEFRLPRVSERSPVRTPAMLNGIRHDRDHVSVTIVATTTAMPANIAVPRPTRRAAPEWTGVVSDRNTPCSSS